MGNVQQHQMEIATMKRPSVLGGGGRPSATTTTTTSGRGSKLGLVAKSFGVATKTQAPSQPQMAPANPAKTTTTTFLPTKHGDENGTRSRLMSCGEAHTHRAEGEIVAVLSRVLCDRIQANDLKVDPANPPKDIFCGTCLPKITVEDYVRRIVHYLTGLAEYERQTGHDAQVRSDLALRYIVMALIYLEKISTLHNFVVCSWNIHRLLITGIMLAAKVVDDIQPKNAYFAQLGGISTEEINRLEASFCTLMKFDLYISVEEFDLYYAKILAAGDSYVMQEMNRHAGSAAAA